jgi:hypothetical protein
MKTFSGGCHCGAVTFTIRAETISAACRCNCSICRRKSALMSSEYFPPSAIDVRGLETLGVYRWGDRMVNHYFCKTCGIYPFHDATTNPGHYRVNLGCLEDFDCSSLPVTLFDGKSF